MKTLSLVVIYNGICKGLDCRDIGKIVFHLFPFLFLWGSIWVFKESPIPLVSTSPFWVASSAKTLHMCLTRIAIWATPSWMIFVVRILSDSHFWCGSLRLFTFPFEMAVRKIGPRNIIGEWMFGLVDGFKHGFYFPYEMSSFALTKSYFSRWLSHHQPEII